jgi:excisionase family DNA binding protein
MTDSSTAMAPESSSTQLLDVKVVAHLLGCSARHVYRMSDGGQMPPPVKLGALVRWNRSSVEEWIAGGCKPCRSMGRR